jgi:predicted nucleic acid-binding Zn ribbon protein
MTGPTRRRGDRGSGDGVGRSRAGDRDPAEKTRGMERLSELLPGAARELGLEDQLEQAGVAAAWLEVVAERIPAAAGESRLIDLRQGIATIEADEPIVAQEIRLRAPELLAALRTRARTTVRQLRVTARHV